MNLQTYLLHSDMRRNTPFRILPTGEGVYVVDGREVPIKEFEEATDKMIIGLLKMQQNTSNEKTINIDESKIFLFDD